MTPEQLQQYVDAALNQRDQFSLVFYPLTIVLSIGGALLISYAREKGKNLATKEDIAEITQKVESIKTDLAGKQHFSRLRYEREIELYREIWTLVHQFYLKSVLAFGWKIPSNPVSEISEMPTKESWQKSRELLSQTIEKINHFTRTKFGLNLANWRRCV
jgi:hypothetical protein